MTSNDMAAMQPRPERRTAGGTSTDELPQIEVAERRWDDGDPLKVEATTWLARAQAAVSAAQAEELRPLGLSPSAFNVLLSLHGAPGQMLEPRELAAQLMVSRPSITGLLDTLEGKGLVERGPHAEDGRRILVVLTTKGTRLIADHLSAHHAVLDTAFADLSTDELAQLVDLLRRIRGAAR